MLLLDFQGEFPCNGMLRCSPNPKTFLAPLSWSEIDPAYQSNPTSSSHCYILLLASIDNGCGELPTKCMACSAPAMIYRFINLEWIGIQIFLAKRWEQEPKRGSHKPKKHNSHNMTSRRFASIMGWAFNCCDMFASSLCRWVCCAVHNGTGGPAITAGHYPEVSE